MKVNAVFFCILFLNQLAKGSDKVESMHKEVKTSAKNETTREWRLNTSNPSKMAEFHTLLTQHGIQLSEFTSFDLDEIDASPLEVLVHKASQLQVDGIIVEDTSFDVEGAQLGVNVRWLTDRISAYVGKRACLRTLLGFRLQNMVHVFEGKVYGQVIEPRGPRVKGFEINPYFLPDGENKTLAENSHAGINPRAIAVANFANRKSIAEHPVILEWHGAWQQETSINN